MTVKELSKLYWLNREVELDRKQLASLEAEIESDKQELAALRREMDGLTASKLDGMPRGTDVHSPVENTVEHVLKLETSLQRKHELWVNLTARISTRQTLIILERDRLEQFIDTIDSSYIRQIFTLRFVNGLQWGQVAASMGEGFLADSLKKACYRYLRKH